MCLRAKYRYIAFALVISMQLFEQMARFGPATAMIGGMVKANCSNESDPGDLCWSEKTQALVIGSFFYGYFFQFFIVTIATRIGFPKTVRFSLFISAVTTGFYPQLAEISPYLVIVTQIFRALLVGAGIAYQFELTRKWALPSELNYVLSASGAVAAFGMGAGSLLAGTTATSIGWQYYFYICGVVFLGLLIVSVAFVPDTPRECRFVSREELELYPVPEKADIPSTEGGDGESPDRPPRKPEKSESWLKLLGRRLYPWSFCILHFCFNAGAYNLYTVLPFYLDQVLNVSTEILSWSTMLFASCLGTSMLLLSKVLRFLDRHLPWILTRMLFCCLPHITQLIAFLAIPSINSFPLFLAVVIVKVAGMGALYSGSHVTVSYEMDPINSSKILSFFNSIGQFPGFLGPLFMVAITATEPGIPDYAAVLRSRWNTYFYALAVCPSVALLTLGVSYLVKPGEWKLHVSLDKDSVVVGNPNIGEEEGRVAGEKMEGIKQ